MWLTPGLRFSRAIGSVSSAGVPRAPHLWARHAARGGQGDRLRLVLFGLGLATALLAPLAAGAAEPSFFDEGRAQAGLEKIFERAGHPAHAFRLEIGPNRLIAEVQDPSNSAHVDRWSDRLGGGIFAGETVSGPEPVALDFPADNLAAKLFALSPADLAVVAKLCEAAIKEAKLDDAAAVSRIELRRQEPSAGPPVWGVNVTSGREHATIYADLDGTITHGDFSGTHRAEALDYEKGGAALDAVVTTIADTLGTDAVIETVYVYHRSLGFDAVDRDHPDRLSRYRAGMNGVYREGPADPRSLIMLPLLRFSIADVDWRVLPTLVDAARDRLKMPGARASGIDVSRPDPGVGDPAIQWHIVLEAEEGTVGSANFDAKGHPLNALFPPGKAPRLDMFDAGNMMSAVDAAGHAYGEHIPMLEIVCEGEHVLLAVRDRNDPPGAKVVEYGGEGLKRSFVTVAARQRTPDWFFDLAVVRPAVARWAELQRDALTRLALTGGKIDRIQVAKHKAVLPQDDRAVITVTASAGTRKGIVVYDLAGTVVDIVKP
jgi:hypothetical protein